MCILYIICFTEKFYKTVIIYYIISILKIIYKYTPFHLNLQNYSINSHFFQRNSVSFVRNIERAYNKAIFTNTRKAV